MLCEKHRSSMAVGVAPLGTEREQRIFLQVSSKQRATTGQRKFTIPSAGLLIDQPAPGSLTVSGPS
jgi:hypothetical protein